MGSSLQLAQKKYKNYHNFYFLQRDINDLQRFNKLKGEKFEIVFFRHPLLLTDVPTNDWHNIITSAFKFLQPGGLMIFSIYLQEEYERLITILNKHTFNVAIKNKNPYGKKLMEYMYNHNKFIQDGYVVIIRK